MRRARGDEPSFTQLVETGGGVVFRVRVPSPFAVEYLSPSVQDLSGRTPEEFYANPDLIFEIAQADDRGKLRALFASQSRVILPATIRLCHLDGSTVWVEFTGVPVHDDAGEVTAFEGIARDITLPMAAERELETERNFVTGILNTTDALVVVLDPAGRIVSLNRACERLSGYTNEESRDLPVWDFARSPDQAEGLRVLFEAVKVDNFPRRRENEWLLRDGGRRLIAWSDTAMLNSSGGVDFVIASGVDVTDQRLAERQTRLLGTALEAARVTLQIPFKIILIIIGKQHFQYAAHGPEPDFGAIDADACAFQADLHRRRGQLVGQLITLPQLLLLFFIGRNQLAVDIELVVLGDLDDVAMAIVEIEDQRPFVKVHAEMVKVAGTVGIGVTMVAVPGQ